MTDYPDLVIEPLNNGHDRPGFHRGETSLDEYLHRQARQDVKRRVSRVFVATQAELPGTILGYYTLSTLSIEFGQLPNDLARKLPRHPIPAALLGRLAVSQVAQGRGTGSMLLIDALKRTLAVSDEIAIHAMVVDAIDERAQLFYEAFGFTSLGPESCRLFLPLRSIQVPG
ncbi:MAG: GNAT family N-acetyltransferase [Pseudohongiellaceae bacterium]